MASRQAARLYRRRSRCDGSVLFFHPCWVVCPGPGGAWWLPPTSGSLARSAFPCAP